MIRAGVARHVEFHAILVQSGRLLPSLVIEVNIVLSIVSCLGSRTKRCDSLSCYSLIYTYLYLPFYILSILSMVIVLTAGTTSIIDFMDEYGIRVLPCIFTYSMDRSLMYLRQVSGEVEVSSATSFTVR